MLPDFLFDTYRQYKNDTNELMCWLVETADKCGYGISENSAKQQQSKTPGLENISNKDGKRAARAEQSSSDSTNKSQTLANLSSKQLVYLARQIVSANRSTPQIPTAVVRTIKKAISARKRCTLWFQVQFDGEKKVEASNLKHAKFTSTLEEVLSILKPYYNSEKAEVSVEQSEKKREQLFGWTKVPVRTVGSTNREKRERKGKKRSERTTHEMKTAFGDLQVEEPNLEDAFELKNSKATIAEETVKESSTSLKGQPNATETGQSLEEIKFAVFCLLEDLHRIRQFLRETWSRYRSQDLSLNLAAATSNTAIDLARRLESGFLVAFPQFTDWEQVMKDILLKVTDLDGFDSDSATPSEWEHLSYILFFPFRQLIRFRDAGWRGKTMPKPKYGKFYDQRFDQSGCDLRTAVARDEILMTEILREFYFYLQLDDSLITEDDLIISLRKLRTEQVALSTCFALQIFVDIHRCLGEDVSRGLKELKMTFQRLLATLSDFLERVPLPEMKELIRSPMENLESMTENFLQRDALTEIKKSFWGPDYPKHSPPEKPLFLFSNHPLLCGVLTFAFTLWMHRTGVWCEVATRSIMVTAHLYNALRLKNHLNIPWPDMDEAIAVQTPSRVFVGSPASTAEGCYSKFRLVQGLSLQTHARNRRRLRTSARNPRRIDSTIATNFEPYRNVIQSARGQRRFEYPSNVVDMFIQRYCHDNETSPITLDHIETLLNGQVRQQDMDSSKEKLRQRWQHSRRLSPLELLAVLQESLGEEERSLAVNYFELNRQCFTILQKARTLTDGLFDAVWQLEDHFADNAHGYLVLFLLETQIRTNFPQGKHLCELVGREMKQQIQGWQKRVPKNTDPDMTSANDIPERGPTTLWGILQPNHPTHNGVCIHIGYCKRQLKEQIRQCMTVQEN